MTGSHTPTRRRLIVAALIGAIGAFVNPVQADDLQDLIRLLETQSTPDVRVKTLRALGKISGEARSVEAIPAVMSCLKDPDPKVREAAVSALGPILYDQKRPCPIELVQMLVEERDTEVRLAVGTYVAIFDRYPDGAVPIFKRAAKHPSHLVRQNVSYLLQVAAPKDPEAVRLIEGLARDPEFSVWNNAEVSLWKINHDVDRYVAFNLKLLARARLVDENGPEAGAADQVLRQEMAGLAYMTLKELLEKEPDAAYRGLIKAGNNDAVAIRRTAVITIRVVSQESAESRNRLRAEGAEILLTNLGDDADEQVQLEAKQALQSLQAD